MNKVIKYVVAYALWIVDLGLTMWLVIISRSGLLGTVSLIYDKGDLRYNYVAGFLDKIFWITFGLGWLAFMIFSEKYFRVGVQENVLLKRFARVTGSVLLCIFGVNLILLWINGVSRGSWLGWLILAAELSLGIILFVSANRRSTSKPN
jgi:hypothetical protein